jgi:hypothetical protein
MTASIAAQGVRNAESGSSTTVSASALAVAATMAMGAEGCCGVNDRGELALHKSATDVLLSTGGIVAALGLVVVGSLALFVGYRIASDMLSKRRTLTYIGNLSFHLRHWPDYTARERLKITDTLFSCMDRYSTFMSSSNRQSEGVMTFLQNIDTLPETDRGAVLFQMIKHGQDLPPYYWTDYGRHLDHALPLHLRILSELRNKIYPASVRLSMMDYIERTRPSCSRALLKHSQWPVIRQVLKAGPESVPA